MSSLIQKIINKDDLQTAALTDPVSKFRVSTPQTLIDTDFEYSLQPTKWESIELVNNIPIFFTRDGDEELQLVNVETTELSYSIKVTTFAAHNFVVGSPFIISGLLSASAEGTFIVNNIINPTTFAYRAKQVQLETKTIYDSYTSYLYPAKFFQSTQYTYDNLVAIETDGVARDDDPTIAIDYENIEQSSIRVITKTPAGFNQNTFLILANSFGKKIIDFDASVVDIYPTILSSYSIHTASNNPTGTGYLTKTMNPYNFESKKSYFIELSDIDYANNRIISSNHGLRNDNFVMYVSPLSDSAIGGLSNYCLYRISNPTTHNFQLQNVESIGRSGGFQYRLFGTRILRITKPGTAYVPTGNPYSFTVTSGLLDWSGRTSTRRYFTTLPITSATEIGSSPTRYFTTNPRSIELFGYYYARSNAQYSFQLQATNAVGYMWIGSNAVEDFNSKTTTYKGGVMANSANYDVSGSPASSPQVHIYLTSNTYLPIRMHFSSASASGVSLNLRIKDPLVAGYTTNTYTNFSTSVHPLRVYGPRVDANETVQQSSGGYWYSFSSVRLGEGATSNFGKHSFHKSYPINYINAYNVGGGIANTLNVVYRKADESGDGALLLKKDLPITIFSRDYLRGQGPGLHAPDLTYNNYGGTCALSTYTKVNISYKITNTIITNTSSTTYNIALSGTPTINSLYGVNLGLVCWIVPTTELGLKDSFYYKNHGIAQNNTIYFPSALNPLLPGGISPTPTTYSAEVLSGDYFRLKTSPTGSVIDITDYVSTELKFVRSVTNANAYSIYAPGHEMLEGTYVQYKTNGNTALGNLTNENYYYIKSPTATRFKLSTTKGGSVISINTNPSIPEAHSIISIDRATDGNYLITSLDGTYGFNFTTPTGIPRDVYTFLPEKVLDLQQHTFKFTSHDMVTGGRVIYKKPSTGDEIDGLTDGRSYFIIRQDADYFRLSSVVIDDISTADNYIALYNQINSNEYIQFSAYPNNANTSNELYHTFQVPTIGGQIKTTNVLTLTHSCNIVYCPTIDFFSSTKLGDSINIHYNELTSTKTIATNGIIVGADAPTTNAIQFNATHNLSTGDSLIYKAGTNYIRGLSNDFTYYVNSLSTTNVALYYSSNAAVIAAFDGTNATGGIDNRIQLGITGITTATAGNFIRYIPGETQTYQVRDINNKNYITLETNISLPSYLGIGTTSSGNALLLSTGLYPRSDSYIEHRAYNGGVEIVPSLNPDSVIIRQTRRYFRYQSGKGIQLSKAINFSAPVEIISMQRGDAPESINLDGSIQEGSYVTVKTRKSHRLKKDVQIEIRDVDVGDNNPDNDIWNGIYSVYDVDANYPNIFYLILSTIPSTTEAGGFPNYIVSKTKWGSYLRAGLMDDQNGIFFEFDGETLFACRRNSIKQVTGTVTCTFNSQLVIGNNTRFTTQLGAQAGSKPEIGRDRIVIRGTTYKVILVLNDQTIYIQPPYRGVTGSDLILSITEDTKTPQSQFSIDPCDGMGPTGFNLDIHKIQMMYIDYSWYGAGKVRYGFKAVNGEVRYVHEFIHNNTFSQAYLRSGNLPARYEVGTYEEPIFSPALLHWGTSVIMDGGFDDDKSYIFTANGKQILYFNKDFTDYNIAQSGRVFTLSYAGATTTHFDSITNRDVISYIITLAGTNIGTIYNELKYFQPGTEVWDQASISFFGSQNRITAYIELLDGVYYMYVLKAPLFTGTRTTGTIRFGSKLTDPLPRNIPLVSLRLAPSVDTGKGALLGQREIINRMQLSLASFGILTSHDCEIKVVLNGIPFYKTFERIKSPSLSQAIYHEKFDNISGGLVIYSVRVSGGSLDTSISSTQPRRLTNNTPVSLDEIGSIGNSIIGGNGIFPDGPDLLTIVATPLDTNYIAANRPFSITARVSWKEAQA